VRDLEGGEAIAVTLEHVARVELDHPHLVGQLADDPLQGSAQIDEPARPVHLQRSLASPERERLEQAWKPEDVVGVEVRHEDLAELDEADGGPQQLALGALGGVEQQAVTASPDEQGRRRPLGGRHRSRGTQEDEVEIHQPILGCRPR
jgi:hypothetical protein